MGLIFVNFCFYWTVKVYKYLSPYFNFGYDDQLKLPVVRKYASSRQGLLAASSLCRRASKLENVNMDISCLLSLLLAF